MIVKKIMKKATSILVLVSLLICLLPTTVMAATTTVKLTTSSSDNGIYNSGFWGWNNTTKTLELSGISVGAEEVIFSLPTGSTVIVNEGTWSIYSIYCANSGSSDTLTIKGEGTLNVTSAINANAGSVTFDGNVEVITGSISAGNDGSTLTINESASVTVSSDVFIGASGSLNGYTYIYGDLTINTTMYYGLCCEVVYIGSTGTLNITGAEIGILQYGDEASFTLADGGYVNVSATAAAIIIDRNNMAATDEAEAADTVISFPDRYLQTGLEVASVTVEKYEHYVSGYAIVATGDELSYNINSSPGVNGGATSFIISSEYYYVGTALDVDYEEEIEYGSDVTITVTVQDEDELALTTGDGTVSMYYYSDDYTVTGEEYDVEIDENGQVTFTISGLEVGEYSFGLIYDAEEETDYMSIETDVYAFEITEVTSSGTTDTDTDTDDADDTDEDTDLADTGSTSVVLYFALLASSALAVLVLRKKVR